MDYTTIILVALFALTLFQGFKTLSGRSRKLPPGPAPLPIIGNLHLLGKHYHKSLSELAKKYGPVMSLRLGQLPAVIVTSPAAARQVLQKQDEVFASRWVPNSIHALDQHKYSVVFLPFTSRWRNIRKAMNSSLFSGTRLDASHHIRYNKVQELIEYCREHSLKGEAVHIDLAAFMTTLNVMSCSMFSKNVMTPNSDSMKKMRDVMWNIAVESGAPNLVDFFPFIKFDLQGVKRRLTTHFSKVVEVFAGQIDERLDQKRLGGSMHNDALDFLLKFIEENSDEFDRTLMERMFLDLFIAGSDTSSSSLEWAMAELLKNPETMRKAKEELAQVVGKGKLIEEADIDRLPYLQCILKETLRLHPPVPTLIPRKAVQDTELCGYNIPKGTKVLVNVWAIARDPNIWENPSKFKPERFLESNLDLRGFDFELLPFGSGRRICPGMPLARRLIPLMLGSLLNSFDWKLEGGIRSEELDMDDKVGIALQKAQPLRAIPIPL